ncbi:hypothetical protein JTB14_019522 [Gonioctena quinquepunctata]|nr:hypothetical protein JTB14_019522 [Gonioctena quinquepunctata]
MSLRWSQEGKSMRACKVLAKELATRRPRISLSAGLPARAPTRPSPIDPTCSVHHFTSPVVATLEHSRHSPDTLPSKEPIHSLSFRNQKSTVLSPFFHQSPMNDWPHY